MRQIVAAVTALAVISVVGWWFLLYAPALEQQAAVEVETADLLRQESQLQNQRQQLRELEGRAPQLRVDLDRLSAYIPPDPDQARLLELFQAAGNASGVEFTALTFTDPAPVVGAPPTSTPELTLAAVTVTGGMDATYFQLMDFLRRLEIASSRAILVTAVGLTEGEAGFPDLSATFSAQIFALIPTPVDLDALPGVAVPEVEGEVLVPDPSATPVPLPTDEGVPPATAPGAQSEPSAVDGEVQVSRAAPLGVRS